MDTALAAPCLSSETDDEPILLRRCLAGDGEAWERLFELHYGPTARFVAQLGYPFQREEVEEICQEAFLTVIRSLACFRRQSRFQTWLFRIAANKARDLSQRTRAAKRGGGRATIPIHADDSPTRSPMDPPCPLPSPARSLIASETARIVGEALRQLPEPNRIIIELRYFGDLSYDEIARTLELNPKTVSSRLSKSLDKLELVLRTQFVRDPQSCPAS